MRRNAELGAAAIAYQLGRSRRSVVNQAHRQRISLRPAGEHRGKLLGEPRGSALPREEREAILVTGDSERAALSAEAPGVCPGCGMRGVEVPSSGLCQACHLRRLAWGHRQQVYAIEAGRELSVARQAKHRALELR